MRGTRHLIIVAAALAFALTTIGAPVSAAGTGKVAIVNGFPGKSLDICINNKEVKSGLGYGRTFFRTLPGGLKSLKFYDKDRRVCRGRLLAKQTFGFPAGSDRTIVLTKFGPRIQHFDNKDFGAPPPGALSIWVWRNASDVAGVSVRATSNVPTLTPVTPSADPDPVWLKGKQFLIGYPVADGLLVISTAFLLANTSVFLHEPYAQFVKDLFRYEWILIGTDPSNARLVFLKRPIPPFL